MSLIINTNMMAVNAARNLSATYARLGKSTERLSSGLRINSAADDAAGLAIREMMKSDIAVTKQGIRNAADAISMIQTADGALGIIDEKLTRMKELAEQASTATYTTVQRDIINSEYQAMAAEIDRIANATHFNGIKLLDGSLANNHNGKGLKIHFGTGNNAAEDYYFIQMGDSRANTSTGLQVGGDSKNDIWGQAGVGKPENTGSAPCCGGGFNSLEQPIDNISGRTFAFGYNWDKKVQDGQSLIDGKHLAGMWQSKSGDSLKDLLKAVNDGAQSRVGIQFASAATAASDLVTANSSSFVLCVGDEVYYWGNSSAVGNLVGDSINKADLKALGSASAAGIELAKKINTSSKSFWAAWDETNKTTYVFAKDGGDKNDLIACEFANGVSAEAVAKSKDLVSFKNMATDEVTDSEGNFSLGGEKWGILSAIKNVSKDGKETWNLTLNGRDVGNLMDLYIADIGSTASKHNLTVSGTANADGLSLAGFNAANTNINGLGRDSFFEVQNAANGNWDGAEVRTQSSAQKSLQALDDAILKKDKLRADLGALQNRLENTITNLTIQAENLQASESRISDVDVATEMTEFTRNNIMAQAATAMLGQANSVAQLALSLIGG